ncbi:MAG TPA: glycosyltransferase [Gemmataceae bacterium]|jgi:glycosyltransferase involved in cell wall biosynthesis|nr:glycosyltransferase [Gemmataceae bacterium]
MHVRSPQRGPEGPVTSLVFPTYNPGPAVEHTWREVARFLERAPGNWEVLFVCDGCTDGTPQRLQELTRAEAERVHVRSYTPNRGKGYAVRQGLEAATGQWRLFTDVDLAYSFEDIVRVADALRNGADAAIASRLHPGSRLVLPPRLQGYAYRRYLQSLIFSRLVRVLLPLTQSDTQAGLKGLSAGAARLLLPQLRCDGFGFDCELLTACVRQGLTVAEVPVCVRYEDAASTTGLRSMGGMMRELWKIRRAWRRGAPPVHEPPAAPGRRKAA